MARLTVALIYVLLVGTFLLSLPASQTYVARQAAKWLNNEYDLDVQFHRARIVLPNKIILNDVLLPDHRGDTLVFAQRIDFSFLGFSSEKNRLDAGYMGIRNGRLNIRKQPQDTVYNFLTFIQKFDTDEPRDPNRPEFSMRAAHVQVENLRFEKRAYECDSCTTLNWYNGWLDATDLRIDGSDVSANIHDIHYRDPSRFDLFRFRGNASYRGRHMQVKDLHFETTDSRITGQARLDYDSLADFSDFLDKVKINVKFSESVFSSEEFRSFIPQFPNLGRVFIDGAVTGTVNDFASENIQLNINDETRFFGQVALKNVTDPINIHIDATIGFFRATQNSIRRTWSVLFNEPLPREVAALGNVDLTGKYRGTLLTLVAEGTLKTDIGSVKTDLIIRNLDNPRSAAYNGKLDIHRFHLGKFMGRDEFGTFNLSGKVRGSGLSIENIRAELDAVATDVEFNGYSYKKIALSGNAANNVFKGDLQIKDPNIDFDFSGDLVVSRDTGRFDFVSSINYFDLHKTGWVEDSISVVTSKMSIDLEASDLKNYTGNLLIDELTYESYNRFYFFTGIDVSSRSREDARELKITSQLITGIMQGQFNLLEIPDAFVQAYDHVLQGVSIPKEERVSFAAEISVHINNTDLLSEIFFPRLYIEQNTHLNAKFDSDNQRVKVDLDGEGLKFDRNEVGPVKLKLEGEGNQYSLQTHFSRFNLPGWAEGDTVRLNANLVGGNADFKFYGHIKDSIDTRIRLEGKTKVYADSAFVFSLNGGGFNIGLTPIRVKEGNEVSVTKNEVKLFNLNLREEDTGGSLNIDGAVGPDETDVLYFTFQNFGLAMGSYLLRNPSLMFDARMNGQIALISLTSKPRFASAVLADSLVVNNRHIGRLDLTADWDNFTGLIHTRARIDRGMLNSMSLVGTVNPDKDFALDFNLMLNRFHLQPFNPFVTLIFSNLRGAVVGEVSIKGTASAPEVYGSMALSSVGFTVTYLNTDYNFEGSPTVTFDRTLLKFDRVQIRDTDKKTEGFVSGTINHNHFKDLALNIDIDANRLLCLNTTRADNEYFFGQAYASGKVNINGPTENLEININATTEKGTDFKIPMTNPREIEELDFITFVQPLMEEERAQGQKVQYVDMGLTGLSLNLNLNVTPDAVIELIMDEQAGDRIKGSGVGNIRININRIGEINMYGRVEVARGEYFLTMQSIISRKFSILPGGEIYWSGNPYDARLNMTARYAIRTTVNSVVNVESPSQRFLVYLDLGLSGPMFNPLIDFQVSLPNASPTIQEELNNRMSDENQLQYQAFSLLLMNSFAPSTGAEAVATVGANNSYQFLASQMGNALSKGLGGVVDVQVNYTAAAATPSEDVNQVTEQLDVGLSKSFFNDRVVINGVVGVPVGSNTNDLVGDVELEYKITHRVRAKAFNRSNQNNPALDRLAPYTQGVGVFYRTDFDRFSDLIFGKRKKSTEKEKTNDEGGDEGDDEKPKPTAVIRDE